MKHIYKFPFFFILAFSMNSLISQEIVDNTINLSVESSNLSVDAQEKIEELDEISKKLYFDYKDTLNEYKALKSYDDQLSKIIDAQFAEIANINNQIDSLDDINIDILPLLKTMTDTLRKVINIDIPFLKEPRIDRVNNLDELLLRADITTAENWFMYDNRRPGYNYNHYLTADTSGAEVTGDNWVDFVSNGFVLRKGQTGTNRSGDTYIYIAIAESPFVTSTGIPTTAR